MRTRNDSHIAFVTLGCAKNEVDTDKMRARLLAAGYRVVHDPLESDAVIVNTCSFLVSAAEESLDTIFDLVEDLQAAGRDAKLLVAGCMPSRYGDDLAAELSEASAFVSAEDEQNIVGAVDRVLGILSDAERGDTGIGETDATGAAATRSEYSTSAYVKISDGCDKFCTYCMIPHIRGRYRSFEFAQICNEVEELVDRGVAEIVLIGQDTGIWGRDLDEGWNLHRLLDELSQRFDSTWFRVLYLQPSGITEKLLELVNERDNICPYFDIPLQHCNEALLSRMNREGSYDSYLDLVRTIRDKVSNVSIRTTFMAGFPTETHEQFEELLDFADDARFDYAVVFPYSAEEGSAAACFEGQVPEDVKIERAQRLLDACETIGFKQAAEHMDEVCEVLIEGYEDTDEGLEALGRTQGQAPDVDGQVHIPIDREDALGAGQIVRVRIVDTFCHDLIGELA